MEWLAALRAESSLREFSQRIGKREQRINDKTNRTADRGLGVGGVFGLAVALVADSVPDSSRAPALGLCRSRSRTGETLRRD
jgi:hypothetical protein